MISGYLLPGFGNSLKKFVLEFSDTRVFDFSGILIRFSIWIPFFIAMVGYPKQIVSGYSFPMEGKEEFVSFLFGIPIFYAGWVLSCFFRSPSKKCLFCEI